MPATSLDLRLVATSDSFFLSKCGQVLRSAQTKLRDAGLTPIFLLVRVGSELSITTSFPASKCGPLAKESNGVRKSSLQLVTATLWDNFDFGGAAKNRSLSLRFSGTPAHFVGGPISMANLEFLKM